jgi:hypothetical protein
MASSDPSYGAPGPNAFNPTGSDLPPPPPPEDSGFDPDQLSFYFVLGGATVVLLLCVVQRLSRWIILRKPVPLRVDDNGESVAHRGSMGVQILGWPVLFLRKVSLRSFYMVGVPSGGTLMMIVVFMGVATFAILFMSGLDLDDLSDRFG